MKKLFSGIQPSGIIHLGNYLGTLSGWRELEKTHDSLFCVVDLHAMTVFQSPNVLKKNILSTARTLMALGIHSPIFVQSHVPQHTQLYWALNTITKVSELELMTQYKDKISRGKAPLAGLFNYPVLMAADILLYDAAIVPVGEDQVQHVELTRELVRRFNALYGKTFIEPRALLQKEGARIMGLDDPTKKMSKSAESEYGYIALTDSPAIVDKKIQRATTDSHNEVIYDPKKKPGISNLLVILSAVSETPIKQLEERYKHSGYGVFKKDVSWAINDFLKTFQARYKKISDSQIKRALANGAKEAEKRARIKMQKVYKKIGLI